jgi:hypothetical protein
MRNDSMRRPSRALWLVRLMVAHRKSRVAAPVLVTRRSPLPSVSAQEICDGRVGHWELNAMVGPELCRAVI